MKKILFFLLFTVSIYGQTYQNPTYGTVTEKNNATDNTPAYFTTTQVDGVHKKTPAALVAKTATVNDSLATKENIANKSDSYTASSSTTYASTAALVEGLATKPSTDGYATEIIAGDGSKLDRTEGARLVSSTTNLYGWGDSLTAGAGGTPYPTTLGTITAFTVTNKGVGGESSTQIKDRFITDALFGETTIIWAGRNNFTSPTTVKADIAAMVASLTHTRYLVLEILNADEVGERVGEVDYLILTQLNADLKALYGNKFVEIRKALVNAHTNSAQDLIDFANDVPPTSLRSDHIHLNTAGYTFVAQYVNSKLGILLEKTGFLQSKDLSYYTYRKGTSTNNYIPRFSDLGRALTASSVYDTGTSVGIGTNNPAQKLDINGSVRVLDKIEFGWGYGGIGTSATQTIGLYTWDGASSVERVRVNNIGAVGIGTLAPSQKLEVVGNILATSYMKSGGTSSQRLMADGSVNSDVYTLDSNAVHKTGDETIAGIKTFSSQPMFTSSLAVKQTGSTDYALVQNGSLLLGGRGGGGVPTLFSKNNSTTTTSLLMLTLQDSDAVRTGESDVIFRSAWMSGGAPTNYTTTGSAYSFQNGGQKLLEIFREGKIAIPVTPTTSAGTYYFLTRNTSTGVIEKINTDIALTGTPTAPTATAGTNTTQIATTAFVKENTDATAHWTKTGDDITNNNTGKIYFGAPATGGVGGVPHIASSNQNIITSGQFASTVGYGFADQSSGLFESGGKLLLKMFNPKGVGIQNVYQNHTSGTQNDLSFVGSNINPTSGNAVFNNIAIESIINQTGGANGITRGIYINPTLTSAFDFRAIEVTTGKVIVPVTTETAIQEYADNAAAVTAGLTIGTHYRTGDLLKIVH